MTLFCTPADDQLERCLAYPNITAHPVPGAVTAEVLLPGGDTGYFSEGVHTLTRTDNSKNCIYNVIVNSKGSNISVSVSILQLACNLVAKFNFKVEKF